MKSNLEAKLLVTGASGHLGSTVVELLLDKGASNLIAVSRSPEKLSAFAERGVEVRKGDFDDSDSLDSAFAGAEILLLVSTDALDRVGHRAEQHERAVDAAVKAGVKHIVYTSLTKADESPVSLAEDHRRTEAKLRESGVSYTVLRNNMYTEMLLSSLPSAIASGKHFAAAGDGKTAYVTRRDCALAAAGAMLQATDESSIIEVSGPEALSQSDLTQIATELSGKEVEYVPASVEQMVEGMVEHGLPKPLAEVFVTFDVAIAEGKHAEVTDAVERLWGEKPTSVKQFLSQNLETLVSA